MGNTVGSPQYTSAPSCTAAPVPQGPKLYILTLGVLAPYRGMGAGSALLERCLQHCAAQLPEVAEALLHVQVGPPAWGGAAPGWAGAGI